MAESGSVTVPSRGTTAGEGTDNDYFDVMARHARQHWWYRNRRAWLSQLLSSGRDRNRALDVGCGTGETVRHLADLGWSWTAGSDVSGYVLGHARRRQRLALFQSRAEALPLRSSSVQCLTSLDVLEHLDDDRGAAREYLRVAEPGAPVVFMVPAYAWLWNDDHDGRAGHRRRYTAKRLRSVAESAGIEVEAVSYFHSFLVAPAFLLRRTPLRRFLPATEEDASSSPLANKVCWWLASAERRVARHVSLPFGLSIWLIGRVPQDA